MSNRNEQINGEIMRALSSIIPTLKDPRVTGVVSITRVDTTRDLSYSKIYISSLADTVEVVKGLKSAAGLLRREVAHTVGLRHVPQLLFVADDSIKEGSRILSLLNTVTYSDEATKKDDVDGERP